MVNKYNKDVQYIQNINLQGGNYKLSDLTDERGQPFNIPHGIKADLEAPEYGFVREQIESSYDLYIGINQGVLGIIDEEIFKGGPENNHKLFQPVPKYWAEANVEDDERRNVHYDAPITEFDVRIVESIQKERDRNKAELDRSQGMMNIPKDFKRASERKQEVDMTKPHFGE